MLKHYSDVTDNGHHSVSNHQRHYCLLNRFFGQRSKETSKLRVTGLCTGNSPETGEFPAQMASNAENVSIWWCHHDLSQFNAILMILWSSPGLFYWLTCLPDDDAKRCPSSRCSGTKQKVEFVVMHRYLETSSHLRVIRNIKAALFICFQHILWKNVIDNPWN